MDRLTAADSYLYVLTIAPRQDGSDNLPFGNFTGGSFG